MRQGSIIFTQYGVRTWDASNVLVFGTSCPMLCCLPSEISMAQLERVSDGMV